MADQGGAARDIDELPVLPALAGAAAGILGVVAVFVFGASLHRLVATPERYGWGWNVSLHDVDVDALMRDVDVEALAEGQFGVPLVLDNRPVNALAITPIKGSIFPTVVEGRAARAPDEVVLGSETLDRLGRDLGEFADAEGPGGVRRFRIVGRGVFPSPEDPVALADGAALTGRGMRSLGLGSGGPDDPSFRNELVRWAPGVDEAAALSRMDDPEPGLPSAPPEIDRLTQVDRLPQVLAGFLALLAVLAMGHALVTAVRRRQADIAILKTLGFVRMQVSAMVAWQATALAVVGLLIGIPLGVVVGRWSWAFVAEGLGIATDPAIPTLEIGIAIPIALVIANLIAFMPGRVAASTSPAIVLRTE
jgi:hypothetical protein